jgi:hypothetical protein
MVRFVKESRKLRLRREQPGGVGGQRFEQDHPGRKIRRDDDPDAGVGDHRAQLRFAGGPAGGADHQADAALRQHDRVVDHRVGCGEIDRHVDTAPLRGVRTTAVKP